jgi:hypothetical protein
MRKKIPAFGKRRFKTFFALFPVSTSKEIRWLEKITIMQEFTHDGALGYWKSIAFIEKDKA